MTDETQTPAPQEPTGNTGTGEGVNIPPVQTSSTSAESAQESSSQPEPPASEETPAEKPAPAEQPPLAAGGRDPAEPPPAYGLTADPPPGIVVGGQDRQASPPDLADAPELAGGNLGPLAYEKHSTEATNEDGEKVPIVVAHPVFVDGTNRRSDNDGLEGQKVEIVDGDHKGRKGVFLKTETYDPQSGYPVQIIVRTDAGDKYELLSVPYASVRPPQSVR